MVRLNRRSPLHQHATLEQVTKRYHLKNPATRYILDLPTPSVIINSDGYRWRPLDIPYFNRLEPDLITRSESDILGMVSIDIKNECATVNTSSQVSSNLRVLVLEHHEKQREFSDIIRKIDVPSTFNFANEEDEVILVENLKPFIVFGCRDLWKIVVLAASILRCQREKPRGESS
ncbi:hypothetical protein WN943_011607 [Citrus x changshan-huyou]